MFQSLYDCEEFSIPDGVVLFCFVKCFWVIAYWVLSALCVVLPKYYTCCHLGGINFQLKRFSLSRLPEDRVQGDDLDEFVKCLCAFICPGKFCSLR